MEQSLLFCTACGSSNDSSNVYCEKCGTNLKNFDSPQVEVINQDNSSDIQSSSSEIIFADFGDRFVAYILDSIIFGLIGLFFGLIIGKSISNWGLGGSIFSDNWPTLLSGFLYFFLLEAFNHGQTLGKMIMHIKTVDETTMQELDNTKAILHIIGKVFFLPIDVIIGLLIKEEGTLIEKNRVRFTQRISQTAVIKI